MNKFVKVSLITAGILFAVGIVFCSITVIVGGGRMIREIWDGRFERMMRWGIDEIEDVGFSAKSKLVTGQNISIDMASENVEELQLMLGAGSFSVYQKEEADGQIDVEWSGRGSFDAYVKNGTLYVEGFKGIKLFGTNYNGNEASIYIPKDAVFRQVNMEVGAGRMEIHNVKANTLDAEIGAGELILGHASVEELVLEVGMGRFEGSAINATNVDISVGMGESVFSGSISGNLDAECDLGNMVLELQGKETDHNYQIECSAGNINLDGRTYTGLGAERSISNGVSSNFDIECNMGNIDISFTE